MKLLISPGALPKKPFPAYEGSCEPLLSARAKSTLEPLPSATFRFSQRTSPSRRERGSPEVLVAPCLPFDSLRGQETHEALVRLYLSKIPSLRHACVHSTFGSASMRVSEARTGPVSSRGGKEGRRSNGETASGHTKLPLHAAGSTPTAEPRRLRTRAGPAEMGHGATWAGLSTLSLRAHRNHAAFTHLGDCGWKADSGPSPRYRAHEK